MKTGLVLEGGAMRGIYSAGVLDYLLEQGIHFDYIVGVSAGCGNAVNYVTGQIGRTKKVITHENAESYFGFHQLAKNHKLLNLDKLVRGYGEEEFPFDYDKFAASDVECETVVVNCETGLAEYLSNYRDKEEFYQASMATCSLPFMSDMVEINGRKYLDGSIVDSIPVKRAVDKGCDRVVLVLTKSEDESATDYSKLKKLICKKYKNYPKLIEALLNRKDAYEKQLEYMGQLERDGRLMVIRPSKPLMKRFEKDMKVVNASYDYGYSMIQELYPKLRAFLCTDD